MKNLITIFFTSLFCLISFGAISQDKENPFKEYSFAFTISPQFLFVNSLKFQVEMMVKRDHSLILSPQLIKGPIERSRDIAVANETRKDGISGFGGELLHKMILFYFTQENQLYFSHGPIFQAPKITYSEYYWLENPENPLELIYRLQEKNSVIYRYGYTVYFGVQNISAETVIMDLYAGIGIRYVDIKPPLPENRSYGKGIWNYAYEGALPVVGIRFGLVKY